MNNRLQQLLIHCITENKENVYRLAFSYVKNKEDALDIVQDSIHKAFSSFNNLKSEGSMKSWFYRVVVNTSLDFLRRQKKLHPVDDKTLELYAPVSEDVYRNVDLEKALDELSPNYRIVIVLRFFEDLKIEEIAEVLGENNSTVKTRLYQALGKLRIKLNDQFAEEVQ